MSPVPVLPQVVGGVFSKDVLPVGTGINEGIGEVDSVLLCFIAVMLWAGGLDCRKGEAKV